MGSARGLTYGIALGAGAMYLFDPRRGSARRAIIEQKARRAAHEIESARGIGARDLQHRAKGMLARLSSKRDDDTVSDDVLVARVRSQLGRVCAHPHAVEVIAKGHGAVELKGPIRPSEVAPVVSAIQRVRGVKRVQDEFEVIADSEEHPELAGSHGWNTTVRIPSPALRFLLGLGAACLGAVSFLKGRPIALLASGATVLALARSIAHRELRPSVTRTPPSPPVRGLREAYPPGSEWAPAPS